LNIFQNLRIWATFRNIDKDAGWHLVSDVDGVLTDGKFHYSDEGKKYKVFGSHDADSLKNQTLFSRITFVSADQRGFEISNRRVEDMGYKLLLMNADERRSFVQELSLRENVVFIGDSVSDLPAFEAALISAAPKGSYPRLYRKATIRLSRKGGEGAIAELVEVLEKHLFRGAHEL